MAESWPSPSDVELLRHLAGESDPVEASAIERWLAAAPNHRRRLEELRMVLRATEPSRIAWDPARSWRGIADRIEPPGRPEIVRERPSFGVGRWRRALIAAGAGAIFAAGWYAQRQVVRTHAGGYEATVALTERRTGRGERASFHLADGTEVMLGPESRLRYSEATYGRRARAVELDGDGYFKVVHDAARPFVVRTWAASVQDLGTRFTVLARATRGRAEVAVAEGRVAVRQAVAPGDNATVPLGAGDAVRVANSGRLEVRHGTNMERYFAWTEGRLIFDRATLGAVVDELERWYDVDIEFGSPELERRMLTARFADKPVRDVLEVIAATLDLRVSGSGRRFILTAR